MDDGVVNDRAGNDSHNIDDATIVFEDEYRYIVMMISMLRVKIVIHNENYLFNPLASGSDAGNLSSGDGAEDDADDDDGGHDDADDGGHDDDDDGDCISIGGDVASWRKVLTGETVTLKVFSHSSPFK